jgi:hypothetical protein
MLNITRSKTKERISSRMNQMINRSQRYKGLDKDTAGALTGTKIINGSLPAFYTVTLVLTICSALLISATGLKNYTE